MTRHQTAHDEPTRLGDYRLLTELARGGMGRVYLARRSGQAGFARLFAVKLMSPQLGKDPEACLMLLDEANIASHLHHPNVVSVHDVGRSEHGYYLVMDYVEGCSLQELLKQSPCERPARLIVPIVLEALRGLHAVHTLRDASGEPCNIVHRDATPHNLLVGSDGSCRVTDFGIAKARERFTDTPAGLFKGKLSFMAPEQLIGNGSMDCRTDVWAMGVTLYTALTGEQPFKSRSNAVTIDHVLHGVTVPPSERGLCPNACFDAVILRALERNPARRFPDAQAFAEALRQVAQSQDLLGSHDEIGRWVEASCAAELERRRRCLSESTSVISAQLELPRPVSVPPPAPPLVRSVPRRSAHVARWSRLAVVLSAIVFAGVLAWQTRTGQVAHATPVVIQPKVLASPAPVPAVAGLRERPSMDLTPPPVDAATLAQVAPPGPVTTEKPAKAPGRVRSQAASRAPAEPSTAAAEPAWLELSERNPYLVGGAD
jgi:serine/threonine protein kinase